MLEALELMDGAPGKDPTQAMKSKESPSWVVVYQQLPEVLTPPGACVASLPQGMETRKTHPSTSGVKRRTCASMVLILFMGLVLMDGAQLFVFSAL